MIDSTYRRALITETNSGISNAIALALAKANISPALVGRSEAIAVEKRNNSIRSVTVCSRVIKSLMWDINAVPVDSAQSGMLTAENRAANYFAYCFSTISRQYRRCHYHA